MQHVTVTLFTLVITAMMITLSHSSSPDGVCYTEGSRLVVQRLTRQETYSTSCGWWGRRCRRTRIVSYTKNVMVTFMQRICCSGYTNESGICRRVEIGFESSTYSVNEDAGSVTVCAALLHEVQMEPDRIVTVAIDTVSGTAELESDFIPYADDNHQLSSSNRSFCFSINISYDYLHEDMETFQVDLRGLNLTSYVHLTRSNTTVQIHNIYRVEIGFQNSIYHVNEDAVAVSVCAAVAHQVDMESGRPLSVSFSTASGTASEGSDFRSLNTTQSFTSYRRYVCVNIIINYDYIYEGSESFTVHLTGQNLPSYVRFTSSRTMVWIQNIYKVEIGFEIPIYHVNEDAGTVAVCAAVPLQADMESGRSLRITFRTLSGTAREGSDFTSLVTTQSISLSRRRVCVNISINYDYDINEWIETFTVRLTGQNLPSYASLTHPSTTVQIQNIYRVNVAFERSTYSVNEDAGAVTVCAVVQNEQNVGSGLSVTFRTVSGSALEGSDFTSFTGTRNFLYPIKRICFNTNITYDYKYESTEKFTVHLTGQNLHSHAPFTSSNTTVHIHNSYKMEIGFEQASQSVREDVGSASVCLRIINPHQGTIASITYGLTFQTHQNGTPSRALTSHDFQQVTRPVTLSSGTRRQCVSVPIIHDHDHETTETFTATLTRQSSLPSYVTINPSTTTIEILNTRRTAIGFEHTSLSVAEDAGSISACVRLLHLSTPDFDRILKVRIETVTGTAANSALSPSDFTLSPTTVSLSSQVRRRCCNITIMDDTFHELSEYFTVTLNRTGSLPSSVLLSPDTLSIRIDNSQRVTIGFDNSTYEVDEDAGNLTVCVTLANDQNVSSLLWSNSYVVDIRTHEDSSENGATESEDFFHSSAIVTLSSSSPRACIAVPIIYDSVFEQTEFFSVTLHVKAANGHVTLQPQSAVVNIRHVHGMLIGFETTNLYLFESSGNANVCVKVIIPTDPFPIPNMNYSVVVTTQSGTGPNGAHGDRDFHKLSSVITLTPTVRRQCISVDIVRDAESENVEMFTIHLNRSRTLPSHVNLSPDTVMVTIFDY